ncbi:VacB/RNase II family 3'-5' exoribonuclease [Collinsella sp. zg1085]|uniref:ribonuclease R family protein n=1 Tax=Collinsella sp. zg1085 TaxID=2844380 RepID=UPI001C0CF9B8|nr:VacB/RNase II family 3'-5' exoribonuclease [Collinsella sp. zg1085]QWT18148.1 VacB/RNase II family 3'-5' exoribonuclease [Collinsella sp. zg1085]
MGRHRARGNSRHSRRYASQCEGIVQVVPGHVEVSSAQGSFIVAQQSAAALMHGDCVRFHMERVSRGKKRAVIDAIDKRAYQTLIGSFEQMGPLGCVRPLDPKIRLDFFVPMHDRTPRALHLVDGDMVLARIVRYPTHLDAGTVTIVKRIEHADYASVAIAQVMATHGFVDEYPEAACVAAEAIEQNVEAALTDPLRRDIRERFVFTIDPVDAQDFDDAISIERLSSGVWRLAVHIADVSHYVAWGSVIDLEARKRATSVYLVDRVIPMLPEKLCNDVCSLVPHQDRLALTVEMLIRADGSVQQYEMYPSLIQSKARMDYDAAAYLLGQAVDDQAAQSRANGMAEQVQRACGIELAAVLREAHACAKARKAFRQRRGTLNFSTQELKLVLDAKGKTQAIRAYTQNQATSVVEEAMLLANECVAEYLSDRGCVALYRTHEAPLGENLVAAAETLHNAGVLAPEAAQAISHGDIAAIEQTLVALAGTEYEPLVNALLLRAMQRALYKPENEGHYALGAPAYCHFTSPIRRYPDLICQRELKRALAKAEKRRSAEIASLGQLEGKDSLISLLPELCQRSNEQERAAEQAARATQRIKIAEYFSEHIGEVYAGTIVWADSIGVFVRLDTVGAEGLVKVSSLGSEHFEFDWERLEFLGVESGVRYGIGTALTVRVATVNIMQGQLTFELAT